MDLNLFPPRRHWAVRKTGPLVPEGPDVHMNEWGRFMEGRGGEGGKKNPNVSQDKGTPCPTFIELKEILSDFSLSKGIFASG